MKTLLGSLFWILAVCGLGVSHAAEVSSNDREIMKICQQLEKDSNVGRIPAGGNERSPTPPAPGGHTNNIR